ncbi:MAG: hypothetical protein MZV63_31815 [Marinilabiliales bacterium]|nr:hypothetical protein [Marinilabiliales bacterium]
MLVYAATLHLRGDPRRAGDERVPAAGGVLMPAALGLPLHASASGVRDAEGMLQLTEREPYRFRAHKDNASPHRGPGRHAVRPRRPLLRAAAARLRLLVGHRRLPARPDRRPHARAGCRVGGSFIPSLRVLTDVVLGEARRREAG